MTQAAASSLYSRIIRFFSAPNSPKTLRNPFRPFRKSDSHRILTVRPLLRRPSVVATPRHSLSGGTTVTVAFSRMSSSAAADSVAFQLSPSSVLKIQMGDITRWSVDGSSDAIVRLPPLIRIVCVNPYIELLVQNYGKHAMRSQKGFRLPASHVIHTVGPIYHSDKNPEAALRNAYRNSLRVAKEHNIQYIAFTAISCGVYGYPFDEAAKVAISTVNASAGDFKEVHFVLFSDEICNVWVKTANQLLKN
ncbi:hypothetical protein SASPL_138914 [Salvia splendens]|uniref:Macro domain-containing protein n=1 Tax=Salvia splendens TaxID=180675 RepID=A0A8X8ZFH7_SALSN|nr:hypothetical protein SASPL_138914 [Salvia splendens]